ncbi:MAG: N-acetyl-gamma-glutamyl-phosphate reductase [Acidobacteriia bacterium]|nr:N-acetyl-gamma-glutamyl-phosphate reductase [Terriglobia bacterium]
MSDRTQTFSKLRTAVVGATGYSGMELVRLLRRHPGVELAGLYSSPAAHASSATTENKGPVSPGDASAVRSSVKVDGFDEKHLCESKPDVVFFATPNETSVAVIPQFKDSAFKIIDLSGGFRLKDAAQYPRWYGFDHAAPQMLSQFIYGLPEMNSAVIRKSKWVANPGCYATSALIPLLPMIQDDLLDPAASIVCDSKSGVSGAGKQPTANTHFCEVSESFKAYSVFSHRHTPEIKQALGLNGTSTFIFTPHLLPINRGIFSTLYVKPKPGVSVGSIRRAFTDFYSGAPFVRIYPEGRLPEIKFVTHTNYCDVGIQNDPESSWLILISCIDNLMKGAAGQAVQNMNLMFGLEESSGLE